MSITNFETGPVNAGIPVFLLKEVRNGYLNQFIALASPVALRRHPIQSVAYLKQGMGFDLGSHLGERQRS